MRIFFLIGLFWGFSIAGLLAQTVNLSTVSSWFKYQGELLVEIDSETQASLDAWERPQLHVLPANWRETILRPYYNQNYPAKSSKAEWEASKWYLDEVFCYSFSCLPNGGAAMTFLCETGDQPYLMLLTFNAQGKFQQSILLQSEYAHQGAIDLRSAHWLNESVLEVRQQTYWEGEAYRTLTDSVSTVYRLQPDGHLIPLAKGDGK